MGADGVIGSSVAERTPDESDRRDLTWALGAETFGRAEQWRGQDLNRR
jgi:hypothetical protein